MYINRARKLARAVLPNIRRRVWRATGEDVVVVQKGGGVEVEVAFLSDPDGAGYAGLAIFEGAQSQDDLALCECCGVSEVPRGRSTHTSVAQRPRTPP